MAINRELTASLSPVGESSRSAVKVGDAGGHSVNTRTVMRTAKTPSENALSRSGVAQRGTVLSSLWMGGLPE